MTTVSDIAPGLAILARECPGARVQVNSRYIEVITINCGGVSKEVTDELYKVGWRMSTSGGYWFFLLG